MITRKMILIVTMLGFLVPTVFAGTNASATIYLTFVTDNLGFYKVRNLEMPPHSFTYENRALNINQGDTVIWENDNDIRTITIVSNQNLWNDKIGQIKVGNRVNYKFDNPGTYTFYVKEESSKIQKIVVSPVGNAYNGETISTPKPLQTATVIHTPTSSSTSVSTNVRSPLQTVTMTSAPIVTNVSDIKLPIKISTTSVASIMVAILSVVIMLWLGKNKR